MFELFLRIRVKERFFIFEKNKSTFLKFFKIFLVYPEVSKGKGSKALALSLASAVSFCIRVSSKLTSFGLTQ